MQKRLDYKDDVYEINIIISPGNIKKFDFDTLDPIFSISEPTGTKIYSQNCNSCEKDVQKKDKSYCDFCGSRACDKCLHKQRRFA